MNDILPNSGFTKTGDLQLQSVTTNPIQAMMEIIMRVCSMGPRYYIKDYNVDQRQYDYVKRDEFIVDLVSA